VPPRRRRPRKAGTPLLLHVAAARDATREQPARPRLPTPPLRARPRGRGEASAAHLLHARRHGRGRKPQVPQPLAAAGREAAAHEVAVRQRQVRLGAVRSRRAPQQPHDACTSATAAAAAALCVPEELRRGA
jgi:hypothetical protein